MGVSLKFDAEAIKILPEPICMLMFYSLKQYKCSIANNKKVTNIIIETSNVHTEVFAGDL